MSKYWEVLKNTFKEYRITDAMDYSSSIAFYLIFSLPAILIITLAIAGFVYEDQVARETLIQQFETFFGAESADAINKILTNVTEASNSYIAQIIGFITIIISATTVFVSLQDGLNQVWGLKSKPNKNLYNFLKNRLLSLAMAVSVGFFLLVTLIVDTSISFFDEKIIELSRKMDTMSVVQYYVISILITTTVLAVSLK